MVFAYDAEDHAAEWWNDWGLLQERAAHRSSLDLASVHVEVQYKDSLSESLGQFEGVGVF